METESAKEAIQLKGLVELNRVYVKAYNANRGTVYILTEKGNRLTLNVLHAGCALRINLNGLLVLTSKNSHFEGEDLYYLPFEGKIDTLRQILEAANNGLPINLLVYRNFVVEANREKCILEKEVEA